MSRPKSNAEGRDGSATFLFGAAMASIAFNVAGAFLIFDGMAAIIFAFGVLCIEVCAFLALRHIIRDWENNHRVKPSVAGVIFCLMVGLCFFSGHTAFERLAIEKHERNIVLERQAAEAQRLADLHFAKADAHLAEENRFAERQARTDGENKQLEADEYRLDRKKNEPLPTWAVLMFLACFEAIKVFGRWAIATETKKILPHVRRANAEAREAEANAAAATGMRLVHGA